MDNVHNTGDDVFIHNLINNVQFNGERCKIIRPLDSEHRYVVSLANGTKLSLKHENVSVDPLAVGPELPDRYTPTGKNRTVHIKKRTRGGHEPESARLRAVRRNLYNEFIGAEGFTSAEILQLPCQICMADIKYDIACGILKAIPLFGGV